MEELLVKCWCIRKPKQVEGDAVKIFREFKSCKCEIISDGKRIGELEDINILKVY